MKHKKLFIFLAAMAMGMLLSAAAETIPPSHRPQYRLRPRRRYPSCRKLPPEASGKRTKMPVM